MRRWILVGVVGIAATVAIIATGLGWWSGSTGGGSRPSAPLAVQTSLDDNAVLYGDSVVAEVDVDYDPQAVAGGSIRIQSDFSPYVTRAAPEIRRTRAGGTGILSYRYTLSCLTAGCLPVKGPRQVTFKAVKATGASGGKTLTATGRWPGLVIASRLAPTDLSGAIRFHRPSILPAPTYAVAPGPLAAGLIAAAVLCALTAFALVGREIASLPGRARTRRLTPLEIALAYARDAASRPDPADRRKALELLAETVGKSGQSPLARAVAESAWSQAPPTPARTVELADRADEAGGGSG